MRIGIDLMGSDGSPTTLFEAVLQTSESQPYSSSFVVYLTEDTAKGLLSSGLIEDSYQAGAARIDLHVVPEFIAMDDEPLAAIRQKKEASLVVGIQQLGEQNIDALVSAGNTGAMIAYAAMKLPRHHGINRLALLALIPTQHNPLAVVDAGGTVSCTAEQLVQYAHIGAAYQRVTLGIDIPTVGLLNIGVESKKGTSLVREVYQYLLKESKQSHAKMRFFGNIEGREVFHGNIDVLVTDGYSGNIFVKSIEGASSFLFNHFQEILKSTPSTECQQLINNVQQHFSYDEYPGAFVCGIDRILVKCHGNATKKSMIQSIRGAMNLVESNLLEKMRRELQNE